MVTSELTYNNIERHNHMFYSSFAPISDVKQIYLYLFTDPN